MNQDLSAQYILPSVLMGRADIARLVREVEALENELEAQKVRAGEQFAGYKLPPTSRSLSDFLELNQVDIGNDQARMHLKEHLRVLKEKAPIMHLTFAVEAEPEILQQLVTWLRSNIHPQALISVGLQPALVGGVYVRTPNHVHDFSLRTLMQGKRDLIVHELEGLL